MRLNMAWAEDGGPPDSRSPICETPVIYDYVGAIFFPCAFHLNSVYMAAVAVATLCHSPVRWRQFHFVATVLRVMAGTIGPILQPALSSAANQA